VANTRGQPAQRPVAAHASQRLGELRRQLGDNAGAAAAFNEAIALFQQLIREAPERTDFARRLEDCRQQRRSLETQ
jgi:hypothetical protein